MTDRERLKRIILELSYEKRKVILASGRESDFYFDGKQTTLHAEGGLEDAGLRGSAGRYNGSLHCTLDLRVLEELGDGEVLPVGLLQERLGPGIHQDGLAPDVEDHDPLAHGVDHLP